TGVGKTTTIAKLASKLKLDKKLNVALITADTYRIAAVKQLEVYANILNIPLKVINNEAEMEEAKEDLSAFDIVLIDTAGRSHKDRRQCDDIERLISTIPEEDREVFLVLSVTTKYRDLEAITEAYSEISDYRLIFTKLDETMYLGNIFNIKLLTGAPLSYATFGQGVPNDISRIDAQTIAKQLLGGGD
ncbi:MAG: flagellar biosynthesis protein FlhF, partial [Lachnospiraceae bacterium]|nr:flagellar biosynthesis protein FlhF [Lachnospiraceae bacterium]